MANRRAFGSVERRKRKDGTYKPNHYAKFIWRGRRYVRAAGPTAAHAKKKLAAAHGLLAAGVTIEEVLSEVFGDFYMGDFFGLGDEQSRIILEDVGTEFLTDVTCDFCIANIGRVGEDASFGGEHRRCQQFADGVFCTGDLYFAMQWCGASYV